MEVQPLTDQVGLPPCTEVLGAPVHIIDVDRVLRLMEQWIRERRRSHWIAVTGSHGALEAHKHPDFRAVLQTADLSVPDGRWAALVEALSSGEGPAKPSAKISTGLTSPLRSIGTNSKL